MSNGSNENTTGLDEFFAVFRNFKKLSGVAVLGSGLAPFVAYLLDVVPPWPPGVIFITAVIELVFAVLVFQFLNGRPRAEVNKWMLSALLLFVLGLITYLSLFSQLTFVIPSNGERWTIGTRCLDQIERLYPGRCPYLDANIWAGAGYKESLLWTPGSLTLVRIMLSTTWFIVFSSLAVFLVGFVTYQSRKRAGTTRKVAASKPENV